MELCNVSGNAWHLSWQVLLDPGTQGHMRLEAKGSYSLVTAAWKRISSGDKAVGSVFPFNLRTNPVERAGGVRPCVGEKHTTVVYTGDTPRNSTPSFLRDLQPTGRAPHHFCKSRPTASFTSGCSLKADSQETLMNQWYLSDLALTCKVEPGRAQTVNLKSNLAGMRFGNRFTKFTQWCLNWAGH